MSLSDKVVITCSLTGVLTDPAMHPVPVTPEEMAGEAQQAYNQGAAVVHCHFRSQQPGLGRYPTWDLKEVGGIIAAIKDRVPEMIINMSTGVLGDDISGPVACLEAFKPDMAALNSGSLNYLKTRQNGSWAWPPLLFDNQVDKIKRFLEVMNANGVVPEFECFDTGIVRSVGLYKHNGMFQGTAHISLVMGVPSGMPAKPEWLPLLIEEMGPGSYYQVIAIGRQEVWSVHRRCAELGGNVRTGVEDTFYLPHGEKTSGNGPLVEVLAGIVREVGRDVASPAEAREILGLRR